MVHLRRASALSLTALSLALTLAGCGGGGGGGGPAVSPGLSTATSANGSTADAAPSTSTPSTPTPGAAASSPATTTVPDTPAPAASAADGTPPVTSPGASSGPAVSCAPGDAPAARTAIFALVNVVRTALQLPQFARSTALDATAQAHAQYAAANGSTGTDEAAGAACFTGASVEQRWAAAGVAMADIPGARSRSEGVIALSAVAGAEPQTWDIVNGALDNLYGRMSLLAPLAQQVGVGFSAQPGGSQRAAVFDAVLPAGTAAGDAWVVWPRDGASGLPVRMTPSNLKPLDAALTEGYPVSVHAATRLQVSRFVLVRASTGEPVATTLVTSANDRNHFLAAGEAALVPQAPLDAGTSYRAELDATVGTQAVHLSWTFTTR